MTGRGLSEVYIGALPAGVSAPAGDLEAALHAVHAAGAFAWPALEVDPEDLARWLACRAPRPPIPRFAWAGGAPQGARWRSRPRRRRPPAPRERTPLRLHLVEGPEHRRARRPLPGGPLHRRPLAGGARDAPRKHARAEIADRLGAADPASVLAFVRSQLEISAMGLLGKDDT